MSKIMTLKYQKEKSTFLVENTGVSWAAHLWDSIQCQAKEIELLEKGNKGLIGFYDAMSFWKKMDLNMDCAFVDILKAGIKIEEETKQKLAKLRSSE